MKKSSLILILVLTLSAIYLVSGLIFGFYRLNHPTYLFAVYSDQPFTPEILKDFVLNDPNRHSLVEGQEKSGLLKRFEKLLRKESVGSADNREFIESLIKSREEFKDQRIDFIWLTENLPVAIIILNDKGHSINLYKG
jgi:hypothetical protein